MGFTYPINNFGDYLDNMREYYVNLVGEYFINASILDRQDEIKSKKYNLKYAKYYAGLVIRIEEWLNEDYK